MAITKEQVFNACDQIFAQGKTPRIEAIRSIVGSGSYSTIGKYLREWKEQAPEMPDVNTTEIPQELQNAAYDALKPVLALIWDKASENIEGDRLKTLETENERLRENLEELAGLRTTNRALLAQLGELNQQLALARAGIGVKDGDTFNKLQAERNALTQERDAYATQVDSLMQQLADAQADTVILTNRCESLEQERQNLQQRNQELAIASGQVEPLQAQLAEAKKTIEALQKQVGAKADMMTSLGGDLVYITPDVAQALEREQASWKAQVEELQAELEALKVRPQRKKKTA